VAKVLKLYRILPDARSMTAHLEALIAAPPRGLDLKVAEALLAVLRGWN
jgi:hypothetical protein